MRQVKFHLDIQTLVRRSGRYDNFRPMTSEQIIQACREIFSWDTLNAQILREQQHVIVVCTTDTFTSFLLWRCSNGFLNSFRELHATFYEAPPILPPSSFLCMLTEASSRVVRSDITRT